MASNIDFMNYKKINRRILIQDLFLIFLLGAMMNISVMVFNENKMPAYSKQEISVPDNYVLYSDFEEVNYPYLSDVFHIKRLFFSFGDVLMFGTFVSIIFLAIINIVQGRKNGTIISN